MSVRFAPSPTGFLHVGGLAAGLAYWCCPASAPGSASRRRRRSATTQAPVRVAVTGRSVGPPLFEPLELLGRDRVPARLRAARARRSP